MNTIDYVAVKRPLLPFSSLRPKIIPRGELRVALFLSRTCLALSLILLLPATYGDYANHTEYIIRGTALALSALPCILLEYWLEKNKQAAQRMTGQLPQRMVYSVDALHLSYMANIATAFLI